MLDLPNSILEVVFAELPLADLASCCCASKELRRFAQEALQLKRSFCAFTDFRLMQRLQASTLKAGPAAPHSKLLTLLGESITYAAVQCPQLDHLSLRLPHRVVAAVKSARQAQHKQPWPLHHSLDSLYHSLPLCRQLRSLTLVNVPSRLFSMDVFTSVQPFWCFPQLEHLCTGRVGGTESIYNHSEGYYCDSLSDMSLRQIAKGSPQLRHLELHRCGNVTDDGLVQVAKNCRQLRALVLRDCPEISEVGIVQIAEKCTLLERLNIGVARCKAVGDLLLWDQGPLGGRQLGVGALFAVAANCSQLQELYISEEQLEVGVIDDMCIFPILAGCHRLRRLALRHVEVTDALLVVMAARCPQLQELVLEHTFASDHGIAAVTKGCQQLQKLCIAGFANAQATYPPQSALVSGIGNGSLKAIAANCTNLRELCISGPKRKVTGEGLNMLAAAPAEVLQHLEVLTLDHIGASPQSMCLLLSRCRYLRRLSVKGIQDGADAVAECVAQHCRHLNTIDMSHGGITDVGFSHLGRMRSLREVHACFCALVTDVGVEQLVKGLCKSLEVLDLSHAANMTRKPYAARLNAHCNTCYAAAQALDRCTAGQETNTSV
ncbi:hypothetical protein WJX72_002021 [[Myrmecia] bisecta]|uniref:F-box domain-containing protein n=1 Tax=[Myrmecia] bisecta TaxID=41462 RepID=A0AAW1Q618_9CHLO